VELLNLLTVAEHIVESAVVREESRGVHLRSDHPERDDDRWLLHTLLHRGPITGDLVIESSPGR
jgi:fumarate reductase flavoprotein subunit